jgi:hypothetical protein
LLGTRREGRGKEERRRRNEGRKVEEEGCEAGKKEIRRREGGRKGKEIMRRE